MLPNHNMKDQISPPVVLVTGQKPILLFFLQATLGSLLLAMLAQWQIPTQPEPIPLQTLGIFLLPILCGGECAFAAAVLFLLLATLGFPVLAAGNSDPLWLLDPTGGGLISWPLAALLIGYLLPLKQPSTLLWRAFCLSCGQLLIWGGSAIWLLYFNQWQRALFLGILPQAMGASIKIALVLLLSWPCLLLRQKRWPGTEN